MPMPINPAAVYTTLSVAHSAISMFIKRRKKKKQGQGYADDGHVHPEYKQIVSKKSSNTLGLIKRTCDTKSEFGQDKNMNAFRKKTYHRESTFGKFHSSKSEVQVMHIEPRDDNAQLYGLDTTVYFPSISPVTQTSSGAITVAPRKRAIRAKPPPAALTPIAEATEDDEKKNVAIALISETIKHAPTIIKTLSTLKKK